MRRIVPAMVALALLLPAGSGAQLRPAEEVSLEREAAHGAIGLYATSLSRDEVRRAVAAAAAGPAVVLELPAGRGEPGGRYPLAVSGEGFEGVLTSDSTRLRGLVTLDDILEGRLEWRADDDAVATVERLDDRIERNDRIRLPLTLLVLIGAGAVALVRPRAAVRVLLVALALNLWLSPLAALAGALAALVLPLGWACAALLGVYLATLGVAPETVALSPLGPSQVGRFYGVNNLLETMLLLPALLGAALLGRLGVVVAVVALVAVAGNRLGADGGGLLVLLAGYGTLAVRLRGERLRARTLALLAAGVVAAGLAIAGLDAATGGSSHVSRALDDGPGALAGDLADRLERSVERTLDSPGAIVVVLAALAVLGWAVRRRGEPVLDALLVALAVSVLVNDTPSDVLAAGAVSALVLARLRPTDPTSGTPPDAVSTLRPDAPPAATGARRARAPAAGDRVRR